MNKSGIRRILAATFTAPGLAIADTVAEGSGALASPLGLSSLAGLATSLVLVIGAILFVGWFYARMRGINVGASKVIQVVAAQALGPKERILVVQIGDQQIAVGMTPGSLQTLHVFDTPVVPPQPVAVSASFADRLRASFAGFGQK